MRAPSQNLWRPEQRRRGSAILEFTLAGTFIFLPMLAGLATVGMSMETAMQVAGLNSSAGQMFASGVDFTQAANQNILLKIAGSLNTSTSGGGIVILSEITYSSSNGYVCANQVTLDTGNASEGQGTSKYAPSGVVNSAFAAMMPFASLPNMASGQIVTAYLAETYYNNPQYTWAFAPAGTGTGIYVKAVF